MNQEYIKADVWSIIEEGYDQETVKSSESLFSLGNGAMGQRDWTEMGGLRETVLTTHWSLVDEVRREGDRDRALNTRGTRGNH